MNKTIFNLIIIFILLVLAQVVIFNHICLFNVATPLIFIYFILRLPITLSLNWTLTLAFVTGLIVDVFSNTQGLNTLSCTILAMSRKSILHLYFSREDDLTRPEPTIKSLGLGIYIKYLFSSTLLYCLVIFIIDAFTFFNPIMLFARIIFSTLLTFIMILGLDSLLASQNEKRL